MAHSYQIFDVFTDTPLKGNPLAVVFDADDLSKEAMQRIAREFNLSETIFFHAPDDPQHTTGASIFTPAAELAFAGHPTVGGSVAFAARRGNHDDAFVIELKSGAVSVSVETKNGVGAASFDAPLMPSVHGDPFDVGIAARGLGLSPADVGFSDFLPTRVACGPSFSIVPLAEVGALSRIKLNAQVFEEALGGEWCSIYCIAPSGPQAFQARMFAPFHGIEEDPATGSAAVAFSSFLVRLADGAHSYSILQGIEMGRPSQIALTVEGANGVPTRVRLSGEAVAIASGTLNV